jgi:hypothetical protein
MPASADASAVPASAVGAAASGAVASAPVVGTAGGMDETCSVVVEENGMAGAFGLRSAADERRCHHSQMRATKSNMTRYRSSQPQPVMFVYPLMVAEAIKRSREEEHRRTVCGGPALLSALHINWLP